MYTIESLPPFGTPVWYRFSKGVKFHHAFITWGWHVKSICGIIRDLHPNDDEFWLNKPDENYYCKRCGKMPRIVSPDTIPIEYSDLFASPEFKEVQDDIMRRLVALSRGQT